VHLAFDGPSPQGRRSVQLLRRRAVRPTPAKTGTLRSDSWADVENSMGESRTVMLEPTVVNSIIVDLRAFVRSSARPSAPLIVSHRGGLQGPPIH
jgi:hypothetical protein